MPDGLKTLHYLYLFHVSVSAQATTSELQIKIFKYLHCLLTSTFLSPVAVRCSELRWRVAEAACWEITAAIPLRTPAPFLSTWHNSHIFSLLHYLLFCRTVTVYLALFKKKKNEKKNEKDRRQFLAPRTCNLS